MHEGNRTEISTLCRERVYKLIGLFGVADQVKADSADMVAALHQMGKEVIMLTGDNDQTAQARKIGV